MRPTYTEIYICDDPKKEVIQSDGLETLEVGVSKAYFMSLIDNIAQKQSPYRSFKRSFKTYCFQDLVMENKDEKDIEVYEKKMLMYVRDRDQNQVHVSYHKKKESFNVFPSTTNLNAIFLTNRLCFLVNSHIYINFDVCRYLERKKQGGIKKGDDCIYKIFVNLNSEKNIDLENSKRLIRSALDFVLN